MSADGFLKGALGVAALSVAYYFAFHLPNRESEASAAEQRETREARWKAAEAEADRRIAFAKCKDAAYASYSDRWNATCARLHGEETKSKQRCLDSGYAEEYCQAAFQVHPSANCALPSAVAADYDKAHKEAEELCLAASKEGLES